MHASDGLLELVERQVPFAAVGEKLISLFKILINKCRLGKLNGASCSERFVVLHCFGATPDSDNGEQKNKTSNP
jgi:hypothetical protein